MLRLLSFGPKRRKQSADQFAMHRMAIATAGRQCVYYGNPSVTRAAQSRYLLRKRKASVCYVEGDDDEDDDFDDDDEDDDNNDGFDDCDDCPSSSGFAGPSSRARGGRSCCSLACGLGCFCHRVSVD